MLQIVNYKGDNKMIKYSQLLSNAIDRYNANREEEEHLDYWEVVDEINDTENEIKMLKTIIEIYENI